MRHDVDNAFLLDGLFHLGMNFLKLKLGTYFRTGDHFGYLQDVYELFEREKEVGIRSSWFFRTSTTPLSELRQKLRANGHEIGFHADRIQNETLFRKDLRHVANGMKISGFTKHGSLGLPSPPPLRGEMYDLDLCIRRAEVFGLSYFCGNDVVPTDRVRSIRNVVMFPSVFWIAPGYMNDSMFTIEWLVEYQKNNDVVVLVHPSEVTAAYPERKAKLDAILGRCEEIASFEEYLKGKSL